MPGPVLETDGHKKHCKNNNSKIAMTKEHGPLPSGVMLLKKTYQSTEIHAPNLRFHFLDHVPIAAFDLEDLAFLSMGVSPATLNRLSMDLS